MEIIRDHLSEFQKLAIQSIDSFDMVDIGCAGGLDLAWREIGPKLRTYAFDSNSAEIARLQSEESLPLSPILCSENTRRWPRRIA